MKYHFIFLMTGILLFSFSHSGAQIKKIDTTLKIGKAGYKLYCNNKSDKNIVSVNPIGFESTATEMSFYVTGKISKAEVDDFNNDGFPDMVIYVYSGTGNTMGTVYAMTSSQNKSVAPIMFPDVMDDAKLRTGYKGHDEFSLLQGSLVRKFPVYKPEDTDTPTGGKRVILYKMIVAEGAYKFKVINTYETK